MRLTTAQALVRWMDVQSVERDGCSQKFFAGCFGIFGHGNVAGLGEALQQNRAVRYIPARNEQAMVHAAAAFAKQSNRLSTYACTTSIGPGATNMVTAAAGATINHLPVLLLPGDVFARHNVDPVLQQLECPRGPGVSVNDCLRPVSVYWDRIHRPEQLVAALPLAMRSLTSVSETGAVTLALPQDVQAEAFDFPSELFEPRTWHIARPRADRASLQRAAELLRAAKRPLIIAGGGVIYSHACDALRAFVERTRIPVATTQAGKGCLPESHTSSLGGVGVTGTSLANDYARTADLIIGIGTRYTDFTTASKTLFENPNVQFVNINVAAFDAHKLRGTAIVSDAHEALVELRDMVGDYATVAAVQIELDAAQTTWDAAVGSHARADGEISQTAALAAIHASLPHDHVIVAAAGSLPGDLHKLWKTEDSRSYHLEYGYSCMGYEIAGALGVKLAEPSRHVVALVGDGSYLMMSSEIVTAIQERLDLTIVVFDNHGYASIGALSQALGLDRFGTERRLSEPHELNQAPLALDFVANAASLGARASRANSLDELRTMISDARTQSGVSVIVVEVVPGTSPPSSAWWDVPVAEVSESDAVREARSNWEQRRPGERDFV